MDQYLNEAQAICDAMGKIEKIQKQYREVKDTKDVSLFEWEILDRAIKELKRI